VSRLVGSEMCIRDRNKDHVFTVESLGTQGYFSAMEHCEFMIGNSSSGIIEAASFGKYVINLGGRQEGREIGENVMHCSIKTEYILDLIHQIKDRPRLNKNNIYGDGNSADKVIEILKKF
jgi:GDP/UDP-N,N'-diacetylbacillosamine 2-epimerase (hydrolysing)